MNDNLYSFMLGVVIATLIFFTVFLNESSESEYLVYTIEITSDFCDGFEEGYCEGWKDVKGQYTVCPVAPVCPVPEVSKDTYNGGYNRGFKKGTSDAED